MELKNLFPAQGIMTEITRIFIKKTIDKKPCRKCGIEFPLDSFRFSRKYIDKNGNDRKYRNPYCSGCTSKKNVESAFRKTEKYLNYQKEYQKTYQRKKKN